MQRLDGRRGTIPKAFKISLWIVAIVLVLLALAIWQRHALLLNLVRTDPPLVEAFDEGPDVQWFDDYYTIQKLEDGIFAIGEPRYWQRNYNYLVIGEERALLIDAGPGVRDINPVVRSLTDLPYTLVFSHLHFDHVGNGHTFPRIAMLDLPYLRERAVDNRLAITDFEHLGIVEGFEAPVVRIDEWIAPGSEIDLGGRKIKVLYTPGHTSDSASFYDATSNILFAGDWFGGYLLVALPNSSMEDNRLALQSAMCQLPGDVRIYSAHKYVDGGGIHEPFARSDLAATFDTFEAMRAGKPGTGRVLPRALQANERVTIYTDFPWLEDWQSKYPELIESQCN